MPVTFHRLLKGQPRVKSSNDHVEVTINLPDSSGSWHSVASLGVARSHPAVAVYDGKIYSFGGGGSNFKSLDLSEVYDPTSDQWASLKAMPTFRSGASAMTVGDAIFVMGGGFKKMDGKFKFLTTVEIYYPKEDRWETGADLNQPHDYPACALLDGLTYIIGGHHPDATEGGPQTDPAFGFTERWDGKTSEWEEMKTMPTPRFASSAVSIGGKLWVLGGVAASAEGFHEYDLIEIFDPKTSKWLQSPVSLPWSSAGQGAVVVKDALYVFGGFREEIGIGTHGAVLDIQKNSWALLPPMPQDRAAMGVAVVDGQIYLVGGWRADRSVKDTVVRYKNE